MAPRQSPRASSNSLFNLPAQRGSNEYASGTRHQEAECFSNEEDQGNKATQSSANRGDGSLTSYRGGTKHLLSDGQDEVDGYAKKRKSEKLIATEMRRSQSKSNPRKRPSPQPNIPGNEIDFLLTKDLMMILCLIRGDDSLNWTVQLPQTVVETEQFGLYLGSQKSKLASVPSTCNIVYGVKTDPGATSNGAR